MKLSAPKVVTWWVAVVIGVLGILGHLLTLPVISGLSFWLVALAFVLFAVATFIEGL